MQAEKVEFLNERGQRLAGLLHWPASALRGGAVVCHGMLSSKDSGKHRLLCEALAELGLASLRFDFAGRGESEGSIDELTLSRDWQDLRAARAFLAGRGARGCALLGSSLGGVVCVLEAAREAPAFLVTMASPSALGSALGTAKPTPFLEDALLHDLPAEASRIQAPWLILHGRRDELIPLEAAHAYHRSNPSSRLEIHPESDHRFSAPDWKLWLADRVGAFAREVEHAGRNFQAQQSR